VEAATDHADKSMEANVCILDNFEEVTITRLSVT
jgi:hypothetical protein